MAGKKAKALPGSAKAIGNKMKARGLGKLKFYCQMCEKQCRDENGYKCHRMSEGHLRKMQLFSSNQNKFLDEFSQKFEEGYVDLLSRRHQSKFVDSNTVYNEYIQERDHVHMNATRWATLSQFIKHLIENSIVRGEETERGYRIQWINRDPKHAQRQLDNECLKRKPELDDEDRRRRMIEEQIKAMADAPSSDLAQEAPSTLDNRTQEELSQLKVSLGDVRSLKKRRKVILQDDEGEDAFADEDEDGEPSTTVRRGGPPESILSHATFVNDATSTLCHNPGGSTAAAFDSDKVEDTAKNGTGHDISTELIPGTWLIPGLVVKIVSSKVGDGKLKKRKAVVVTARKSKSSNKIEAELQLMDDPDQVVFAKESHLETVLPDVGGCVLVVSPDPDFPHRGERGTMAGLVVEQYKAKVHLPSRSEAQLLDYENVCRYFEL
mmetsp:Transcript_14074/g.22868  ORF Transcript_14074/g.22868 Transcript_14074/m.22868 type:complete len:436 (+) Transcript_14074:95-1402(+)